MPNDLENAVPLVRSCRSRFVSEALLSVAILASLGGASHARAEFTFEIVKSFSFAPPQAYYPEALALGADGALYGTTLSGGRWNGGTVFKIDRSGTFSSLHSFSGPDGRYGLYVGQRDAFALVPASDGSVYGATPFGGASGSGTVFKVDGAGTFTSLHSFGYSSVGSLFASVTFVESDGALYGTTGKAAFKIDGAGTFTALPAFEDQSEVPSPSCSPSASTSGPVVRGSDGALYGISTRACEGIFSYRSDTIYRIESGGTVTPLHRFDPSFWGFDPPYYALVLGSDGALYGTTDRGGSAGSGSVFRIDNAGDFTTLHSFNGTDGSYPWALALGSDDALYGTTLTGGSSLHLGTIFRIDRAGVFASLYTFQPDDGANGRSRLILGSDGALYGTQGNLDGPVFRVDSAGNFTNLHWFNGTDGYNPYAPLVVGSDGAFYGTAMTGGPGGGGVVYRIPEPVQGLQLGASAAVLVLLVRLHRPRTPRRQRQGRLVQPWLRRSPSIRSRAIRLFAAASFRAHRGGSRRGDLHRSARATGRSG